MPETPEVTADPTIPSAPPLPPPPPAFTDPRQALYAALLGAFITSAVPVVERQMPGSGRGSEKFSAVAQVADNFILTAAPLAGFIPHTNPLTAFLTAALVQQAYSHALANRQVQSHGGAQAITTPPSTPPPPAGAATTA